MSKYNTQSNFPYQIDPLLHFSDINLENEVALTAYGDLIKEKKYDEAISYLESHDEVDAYCSDLFNTLVNRTKAVQEYSKDDYVPASTGNPIVLLDSIPDDASEYDGKNVICVSGAIGGGH